MSSTRTSSEGPVADQPIPLGILHPLVSESRRGERANTSSRDGRPEGGSQPPPGLRGDDARGQERNKGCLSQCFN